MVSVQILGAGAIGSFLAASMEAAGFEVTIIVRESASARLRDNGITLLRNGRRNTVFPRVYTDCTSEGCPDIAILCTKSQDLAAALNMLDAFAENPPVLVTVQNGVDAPRQVAFHFPKAAVLAARVHGFFEFDGSCVRHVGVEPSVLFGAWNAQGPEAALRFGNVLSACGIANTASSNIEVALWEKLLLASSIGGVGAALALPAGRIVHDRDGREMLAAAMQEVAALAALRGIALSDRCVEKTLEFVGGFPADAASSLQRDLEAHRASEFDQLTGAVIRMAEEAGCEVPVHRQVADRLAQRGLLASAR